MSNKLDLVIDQGSSFSRVVIISDPIGTPINIATDSYAGQMRTSYTATTVTASFVCSIINAATGLMSFRLDDTTTAQLSAGVSYVYDIERTTADGTVTRLIYGKIKVTPEVTK